MKNYSTVFLGLVCVALIVTLIFIKSSDNTQHTSDVGVITGYSNQLSSVEMDLALSNGRMIEFSNNLDQCQSSALTFSNQLNTARSNLDLAAGQITNLTGQVASLQSENQTLSETLNRRVTDLTNQVARLTTQLNLTVTNLDQADRQSALLDNRLRRDVAARLVVEQKFYNPVALQEQLDFLKQNPDQKVTADSIYAGLDLEVTSNSVHAISPADSTP